MIDVHALIIDDDANNCRVLGELLTLEGISHTQLSDAKRLDETLSSIQQFNIVFLDLEMPGVNGFEVFEALRSDARFETVPIVAYSVHINRVNLVRKKGFSGFISKPIDVDRFSDQFARLLRNEQVWAVS